MSNSLRNRQQVNAPFRAKSAGISLIAILIIGLYYFVNVLEKLPTDDALPDGALTLAITAVVLIVIIEAALQTVLFIGAGQIEDRTDRDNLVSVKAVRNAYYVLNAGIFVAFGGLFAGLTAYETGNLMLLAFLLAEIVKFGSQLVYYRGKA